MMQTRYGNVSRDIGTQIPPIVHVALKLHQGYATGHQISSRQDVGLVNKALIKSDENLARKARHSLSFAHLDIDFMYQKLNFSTMKGVFSSSYIWLSSLNTKTLRDWYTKLKRLIHSSSNLTLITLSTCVLMSCLG